MRWVVVRSVLFIVAVCAGACQQSPTDAASPSPSQSSPQTATASVESAKAAAANAAQPHPNKIPSIDGAEALDMKSALALRAAQHNAGSEDCDQDDAAIGADPVFNLPEAAVLNQPGNSQPPPAAPSLPPPAAPSQPPPSTMPTLAFEPVNLADINALKTQPSPQPSPQPSQTPSAADIPQGIYPDATPDAPDAPPTDNAPSHSTASPAANAPSPSSADTATAAAANGVLVVTQTPLETFVTPEGLPKNTRRVREGYWIGGRPQTGNEIEALYNAGVRVIISGVLLDDKTFKTITKLGIRHLRVPFGQEFPSPDKLLGAVEGVRSSEVFVHCEHGSDRSGAMIAFFLVLKHGWRPDHALLAMTSPSKRDIDGQLAVLKESGLHITQEEIDTYWGIYSGHKNGGIGGLKVRDKGYKRLINTTLAAMTSKGIRLDEDTATGDMTMTGRPEHVLEMP